MNEQELKEFLLNHLKICANMNYDKDNGIDRLEIGLYLDNDLIDIDFLIFERSKTA